MIPFERIGLASMWGIASLLLFSGALLRDCDGHWQPVQPAYGHEAGSPFGDWLMHLKQPDNPVASCCGEADQYYPDEVQTDYSTKPSRFVVRIGAEWVSVPPEKVDWESVNPTGRAVIFLSPTEMLAGGRLVYCFIPAAGV